MAKRAEAAGDSTVAHHFTAFANDETEHHKAFKALPVKKNAEAANWAIGGVLPQILPPQGTYSARSTRLCHWLGQEGFDDPGRGRSIQNR